MKQISASRRGRLGGAAAVLLVGGLIGALSLPGAAFAQGADVYGVGGGKGNFVAAGVARFTFDLSAHDYDAGPNGDFGHVGGTLTDPAGNTVSYRMVVDCVAIPNLFGDASISGIVTKTSGSGFEITPGARLFVGAHDGGNPSNRPVDWFAVAEVSSIFANCDLFAFVAIPPNVTQGNIVIKQG
jgi:hypothetical protein